MYNLLDNDFIVNTNSQFEGFYFQRIFVALTTPVRVIHIYPLGGVSPISRDGSTALHLGTIWRRGQTIKKKLYKST